jgi:hypothetical protein
VAVVWAGWWAAAGPTVVGCYGASELRPKLGGVPTDFMLLGRKQKRTRMKKAEGYRSKRFEQFK